MNMISKNQIAFIRSLQQKKVRRESGLFLAEGAKIVPEILRSGFRVKELFALPSWCRANQLLAGDVPLHEVKEDELARLSGLVTANETIALVEIPTYTIDYNTIGSKITLVLDDIRDPGNLGTIIRIADWFGIAHIVCSEETAEAWNPKVVQASMGSICRVQIHYVNLETFFAQAMAVKKRPVYGAFLDGENIYRAAPGTEGFLVIGNEAHGISEKTAALITKRISIPSFSAAAGKTGEAESLNAAVATAILCSEFHRSLS